MHKASQLELCILQLSRCHATRASWRGKHSTKSKTPQKTPQNSKTPQREQTIEQRTVDDHVLRPLAGRAVLLLEVVHVEQRGEVAGHAVKAAAMHQAHLQPCCPP